MVSKIEFKRDEDFEGLYANNIVTETSIWDLKLIFGLLDQSVTPNQVVQHTSINIPWAQVKLLVYALNVAITIQEHFNEKIHISSLVMPSDPAAVKLPENSPFPPIPEELKERVSKLWKEFKESQGGGSR
jgi:hypothetical protein